MSTAGGTAIVWFRRDLRVADNPALIEAVENFAHVLPVFIHAPDEEAPWQPGAASLWWLHHSLAALAKSLAELGAPLVIRHGESLAELRKLIDETGAEALCFNRLYEPAVLARDKAVEEALVGSEGIAVISCNAALMVEPWEIETGGGAPYRVFTPFWKNAVARKVRDPLSAPNRISAVAKQPKNVTLDSLTLLPKIDWDAGFRKHWKPGEAGAWARLERFCDEGAAHYRERRDLPASSAHSSLSPHLHFGEIGPVQVVARTRQLLAEDHGAGLVGNVEHFIRELGWREFAHHLLFHFPDTTEAPLNAKFKTFPWRDPDDYASDLAAWQRGRTGVPIVDAGMRELWHTGVVHNRVRMIVASYLTKNLLIPWQEGARWFWDTLVDADLANNSLGWQWIAGSGADAAPYFRIFSPVLQSGKFDGAGVYLRRWIPELGKLPDAALHAPWEAKLAELKKAKVTLGSEYPEPLVDLPASRERALTAYGRIRQA